MTIEDARKLFDEDNKRRMLSTETIKDYSGNIARFADWLAELKITKARNINGEVIDGYRLYLSETNENKTTVNTYLRHVRRFMYFLMEKKEVKPFKIPLIKDAYKIKSTFDTAEVERILASVDPQDDTSVIMLLLLSTGMRSRSLCELHVGDIDFSDGYVEIKNTKSGVPLCLPLTDGTLKCLKDYIYAYGLLDSDYLFRNVKKNKFNRYSLVQRINKRLAKLEIHKTGVHIFRHTFGKIMSMNGCPTAVLQKWLGHSDIKITERYTNLYCNDLRKTLDKLPTNGFIFT